MCKQQLGIGCINIRSLIMSKNSAKYLLMASTIQSLENFSLSNLNVLLAAMVVSNFIEALRLLRAMVENCVATFRKRLRRRFLFQALNH